MENTAVGTAHDITQPILLAQDPLKDMVWGATADGLQAGMRILGNSRAFTAGERVPMEYYVRNTTDHEIAFSYTARIYSQELPQVRDATDPTKTKKVQGVFLTGLDSAIALSLKPGEAVNMDHPGILLGDQPQASAEPGKRKTGLERWPYLEEPTPGDYLVQQAVRYHLRTQEEVKWLKAQSHAKGAILNEPCPVTVVRPNGSRQRVQATLMPFFDEQATLVTGETKFRILRDRSVGPQDVSGHPTGADSAAVAPGSQSTQKSDGVFWGMVVDGLQAGLRAPHNRNRNNSQRFAQGETMKLDFLIRNVGNQTISFQYETHPGVKMALPEVTAANGQVMALYGEPGALVVNKAQAALKPGMSIVIGQTSLGLSSTGDFPPLAFSHLSANPGRYRIEALHEIQRDDKNVILYTGKMPFELLGKPQR